MWQAASLADYYYTTLQMYLKKPSEQKKNSQLGQFFRCAINIECVHCAPCTQIHFGQLRSDDWFRSHSIYNNNVCVSFSSPFSLNANAFSHDHVCFESFRCGHSVCVCVKWMLSSDLMAIHRHTEPAAAAENYFSDADEEKNEKEIWFNYFINNI